MATAAGGQMCIRDSPVYVHDRGLPVSDDSDDTEKALELGGHYEGQD